MSSKNMDTSTAENRLMWLALIVFLLCMMLSGCFISWDRAGLGQGKCIEEFYKDGSIKKRTVESTFLPKLIDFSLFKATP